MSLQDARKRVAQLQTVVTTPDYDVMGNVAGPGTSQTYGESIGYNGSFKGTNDFQDVANQKANAYAQQSVKDAQQYADQKLQIVATLNAANIASDASYFQALKAKRDADIKETETSFGERIRIANLDGQDVVALYNDEAKAKAVIDDKYNAEVAAKTKKNAEAQAVLLLTVDANLAKAKAGLIQGTTAQLEAAAEAAYQKQVEEDTKLLTQFKGTAEERASLVKKMTETENDIRQKGYTEASRQLKEFETQLATSATVNLERIMGMYFTAQQKFEGLRSGESSFYSSERMSNVSVTTEQNVNQRQMMAQIQDARDKGNNDYADKLTEHLKEQNEQYKLQIVALGQLAVEQKKFFESADGGWAGMKTAMKDWADNANDLHKQMGEFTTRTFDKMGDALANFVVTGKLNFKSLAADILSDLAKIAVEKAIAGLVGSLFGSANGNAFSNGRVIPYANGGVVSGPTTFPMAGGQTGVMGEAGPEAVMPLTRGSDGKLGVHSSGGSNNVAIGGVTINVVKGGGESDDSMIDRISKMLPTAIVKQIRNEQRSGGVLNPVNRGFA